MEVHLDGAKTFLADYGKGFERARPTVLFVHGAGMDHSIWPLQARHFAYRGWNALALDLPGHGQSDGELRTSIPALADWLWDLIKALDVTSVHLVGHSMGALIAWSWRRATAGRSPGSRCSARRPGCRSIRPCSRPRAGQGRSRRS